MIKIMVSQWHNEIFKSVKILTHCKKPSQSWSYERKNTAGLHNIFQIIRQDFYMSTNSTITTNANVEYRMICLHNLFSSYINMQCLISLCVLKMV